MAQLPQLLASPDVEERQREEDSREEQHREILHGSSRIPCAGRVCRAAGKVAHLRSAKWRSLARNLLFSIEEIS